MATKQEAKLKMLAEQHKFYIKQATSIYLQLEEYTTKQLSEDDQIHEFNKLNTKYEKLREEKLILKEKIEKLENDQLLHVENFHCLEKIKTPEKIVQHTIADETETRKSKFNSLRNSFEKKDLNTTIQDQINLIEKMTLIQKDVYNQILLSINDV